MSEKSSYQLSQEEKKLIWDATNPRYLTYLQASVQFSLLAVRTAFILNGGMLFALPTFLIAVRSGKIATTVEELLIPASFFVGGIIFAALSNLAAYLNFQWNVFSLEFERIHEFSKIDEAYDETHTHRLMGSREQYRGDIEKLSWRTNRKIGVSYNAGLFFAVSSFVTFIVGCYWSSMALLH